MQEILAEGLKGEDGGKGRVGVGPERVTITSYLPGNEGEMERSDTFRHSSHWDPQVLFHLCFTLCDFFAAWTTR